MPYTSFCERFLVEETSSNNNKKGEIAISNGLWNSRIAQRSLLASRELIIVNQLETYEHTRPIKLFNMSTSQKLQSLWAALNALGDTHAAAFRNSDASLNSNSPPNDATAVALEASESELKVIAKQIKEVMREVSKETEEQNNNPNGGANAADSASSSSSYFAQLHDLMSLLEEMQTMHVARRTQLMRQQKKTSDKAEAASAQQLSAGEKKANSNETDTQRLKATLQSILQEEGEDTDDDEDDTDGDDDRVEVDANNKKSGKSAAHGRSRAEREAAKQIALEEKHKETVDAVMAHLETNNILPFSPTSDQSSPLFALDDAAFDMSLELLKDKDVRESFIELNAGLQKWADANSIVVDASVTNEASSIAAVTRTANGSQSLLSSADDKRYVAQLVVTRAMCRIFASNECVALTTNGAAAVATIGDAALKSLVGQFKQLMDDLTNLGDAPNGLYGPM